MSYVPFGAENDALPGERPFADHSSVVAGQGRIDPHDLLPRAMETPERYVLVILPNREAAMPREISRRTDAPHIVEIVRTGAKDPAIWRKRSNDVVHAGRCTDVDDDVKTVDEPSGRMIGQFECNGHLRVLAREGIDHGCDMKTAKAMRRSDRQVTADDASAVSQSLAQRFQRIGHKPAVRSDEGAFLGETEARSGTVDQTNSHPFLQRSKPLRHGRRRYIQGPRGFSQRPCRREHRKKGDIVRRKH